MNITLNGQPTQLTQKNPTVKDAIETTLNKKLNPDGTFNDGTKAGIAAALGTTIIKRSEWATTPLPENDTLDIITAVQGG